MNTPSEYHPLIKRLLDGEIRMNDLPPELVREGQEAMALLANAPVARDDLSPWFDQKVMSEIRRRPRPVTGGWWGRAFRPREVRLWIRPAPWILAAAAGLALLLAWPRPPRQPMIAVQPIRTVTYVRFMLYAPNVSHVAIAGSFNEWDAERMPLAPVGTTGLWTTTLRLPPGQHLYAFVVNGREWLADPGVPSVDDGFGRRNSVITLPAAAGSAL